MLTTIRQPFERMGTKAARLLLERLEMPHSEGYSNVILDAPLITRDAARSALL